MPDHWTPRIGRAGASVALIVAATAAHAHHPMGGVTPTNAWHGLLSGFGYPILGLGALFTARSSGLLA